MQIKRIGNAKIITSDNVAALRQFPDDFVDLTVTSPPYDNLRTYNGFTWDFESLAKELYRVTKPGGVVVWVVGDATVKGSETGTSFRQALFFKDVCGFNLHDTMIYRKENYTPLTHNRYEQEWEYMFVLSKGKPKTFNPLKERCKHAGQETWGQPSQYKTNDGTLTKLPKKVISDTKITGNIFTYRTGSTEGDKIAKQHPARFPEALANDHILSWSNEGDVVLDPFMGSGTTGKMALLNNRKFVGIELSPDYVEIARKRIADATTRT